MIPAVSVDAPNLDGKSTTRMAGSKYHSISARPPLSARLGAAALAMLVMLLGLLAVSPEAHAWTHTKAEATADADHDHASTSPHHHCAITEFAHGVTPALDLIVVSEPVSPGEVTYPAPSILDLPETPWRLLPGRGPPAV
jgi:hypothetical protein